MTSTPVHVGRKPRRLYVRLAVYPPTWVEEPPDSQEVDKHIESMEFAGRLVASGELTEPKGQLLIFRADDRAKAEHLLRSDPLRKIPGVQYQILDWKTDLIGAGINIEPPPSRGTGRITQLQSTAVVVRDRVRATAWYREVLGFLVLEEDNESGFVQLGLGRGSTGLSLVAPRPEWGEPLYSDTRRRIGVPTGVILRTDSVRALELRLRNAGVRITESATVEPWGRTVIRFLDPDGNEFLAFEETAAPDRPATP
ncbi:MAG TPA: VOC family protein [Thermoplasmata archaeon]|nr:VOC family protein [Thermoplasmata archaeon]